MYQYHRIGIIGAMDEEVDNLINELHAEFAGKFAHLYFYTKTINSCSIVIVRSGIGKVNAAMCTQILIDKFNVSAIINTGVAGSLNLCLKIGDIVLSKSIVQHDMDTTAFGDKPGEIPRLDCSEFKGDRGLMIEAEWAIEENHININSLRGIIASGDQFIANKEKKSWIVDTFGADCVEMEGAAIAQVCHLNSVPFLIIRAISDNADGSAEMSYDSFKEMAIENTVKIVKTMIENLCKEETP